MLNGANDCFKAEQQQGDPMNRALEQIGWQGKNSILLALSQINAKDLHCSVGCCCTMCDCSKQIGKSHQATSAQMKAQTGNRSLRLSESTPTDRCYSCCLLLSATWQSSWQRAPLGQHRTKDTDAAGW